MPVVFAPEQFGEDRNQVYDRLKRSGIGARKYFYPLTSACDCYRGRFCPEQTPEAMKASLQVLTLPLFAGLEREDVDMICDIVLNREGR